jgi:hypothetical protein
MEPIRERVYLAGEALHETMWGTVGGAWESGERAADAVLRRLAGLPDPTVVRSIAETPPAASTGRRGRTEPDMATGSTQRPRASKKSAPTKPAKPSRRQRRAE